MKYELTIFKSRFDNKTHKRVSVDSWGKFVELLYGLYDKVGEKGGSNSSPLISPALFKEGSTRANDNTLYWGGWCALDVDDHDLPSNIEDMKKVLLTMFGKYDFVCYNTPSSKTEHPKFRLVFRTDRQVTNTEIRHFWYAMNIEAGELGDPATKDLARMYYVPAQYPNANSFIFTNVGNPIDISALMNAHPFAEKQGKSFLERLPPELQTAVINYRKGSLENTNYSWSSYHNCPFVNKRMVQEYKTITGTGWYHKSFGLMLTIAGNAVRKGYPITADEISELCKGIDSENSETRERYAKRNYLSEADRAIEQVYKKGI